MTDDPALRAHAGMRGEGARLHRPSLIVASEPEPEVRVLGPQRKAREESRPHEVAPAPEHGSDLDLGPRAQDLVERAGRARAALLEAPTRAASRPEPTHSSGRRYGQTCLGSSPLIRAGTRPEIAIS